MGGTMRQEWPRTLRTDIPTHVGFISSNRA